MRTACSFLLAALLTLSGLVLLPSPAYAAAPAPCPAGSGPEPATCTPTDTAGRAPNPPPTPRTVDGERTVEVPLSVPATSACQRGAFGQVTNRPCYRNWVQLYKWNDPRGEDWVRATPDAGASPDETVDGTRTTVTVFNERFTGWLLVRASADRYETDGTVTRSYTYTQLDLRQGRPTTGTPTASFTSSVDVGTVDLRATSTDPTGQSLTHTWDFGDGQRGSGVAPTHRYAESGSYTVSLTSTDTDGLSSTTSRSVTVVGQPLQITSLVLDPASPVPLGSPLVARVTVRNDGVGTISAITPTAELTPAGTVAQRAGDLPTFALGPGASRTVEVAVETLAEGRDARIRVRTPGTYQGRATTATASLVFDVSAAPYAVTWSTDPVRPGPGEPFVLTAQVVNASGSSLRDVTPALTLDPAAQSDLSAASPAVIASLAQGAGVDVRWRVSGQRDLDVRLRLTGQRADGSAVTGAVRHRVRLLDDITVTDSGDEPIDPGALADGDCDTDDDPSTQDCTLRAAIQLANTEEDATIGFDLPGTGVPVIAPGSGLPVITAGAEVDGRTQRGGWVRLDGTRAGFANGVTLAGRRAVVRGLVIGWFRDPAGSDRAAGVSVRSGTGHVVAGNRIGTDPTGADLAPNDLGVYVADDAAALVGGTAGTTPGTCTGDCNLLAGNSAWQVKVEDEGSAIRGNLVGMDLAGTRRLGARGIEVGPAVEVGGRAAVPGTAPGNVIAGSTAVEVTLNARPVSNPANRVPSLVRGNLIGLDPTGQRAVQAGADVTPRATGVHVWRALAVVGGSSPGDGNVISGFRGDGQVPDTLFDRGNAGVSVAGGASVRVEGNRIGTDRDGTRAVPNLVGVSGLDTLAYDEDLLDAVSDLNVIGNQISGNDDCGVMYADTVTGNRIGTGADGTSALPNLCGVRHADLVGGVRPVGSTTCEAVCNLISGNLREAVWNPLAIGVVQGNFVGTDLTGTSALPNGTGIAGKEATAVLGAVSGDQVGGASGAVAGTCDRACNLVAGNALPGVAGRVVQGNVIGQDAAGRALPNVAGVRVSHGYRVPGATSTTIGGDGPLGNRITDNTGAAVDVFDNRPFRDGEDPPYTRLEVRGNVVTGNGAGTAAYEGIPLSGGAWPSVLGVSATRSSSEVLVTGITAKGGDSRGTVPVTLDVTSSALCEPSQHGQHPLGSTTVAVGSSARAGFSRTLRLGADQRFLTVTATSRGFTSRPSCVPIEAAVAVTASSTRTARGDRRMEVAANDAFAPGDHVVIEPGTPRQETARVARLGSLVFSAPLRLRHPVGAAVWRVPAPGGDRVAPRVDAQRPQAGATYRRGQRVRVRVRCTDAGVGVVTCAHPRLLPTGRVGRNRLQVTAVDANGNLRRVSVPYRVVRR